MGDSVPGEKLLLDIGNITGDHMRKIAQLKIVRLILRCFFSIFYQKKYLVGKYFDQKSMGWLWAWRGLHGRIWGENRNVPWPVHPRTIVQGANNITFPQDSFHIFQVPGCYWQAFDAKITVGTNCHVAPNVGIVTTNHDIHNPALHVPGKDITIQDNCWIGMNSVILSGVVLGENTIVAAGAVVTKSFPEGHCVIGGVPAKVIKQIEAE